MPIYRPFVVTTLSIMCGFTMIRDVVSLTDSVSLEQFQTIQTSSARRSHSYLVNQHLYLAVVNYNTQCDIYRLKGTQFSLVQHIKVNNANAARFFDVDGEYFLAIAKLTVNETQYNTVSPVLKFNNKSQQFETFQKFPSKGAFDWEYFHVCANEGKMQHFLVLVNSYDGIKYALNSSIYIWNTTKKQFSHFQDIPTKGAHHASAFAWRNKTYVAFANYVSSSVIYQLNSNSTAFILLQTLPNTVYGSWAIVPINLNSALYLINVIYQADEKYETNSLMFKWTNGSFERTLNIPTQGTTMICPFHAKNDTYLALSNYFDGSTYNVKSSVDQVESSAVTSLLNVPTHGSYHCHIFYNSNTTMIMFSNSYNDKTTELDSVIYNVVFN